MLEITNRDWKDVDLEEIESLTFDSLQDSVFFQADRTHESVLEWLKWNNRRFPPTSTFLAHINGKLVGWLTVTLDSKPLISETWRWVPYLSPEVKGRKYEVATALIRKCVNYVKTHGQTRLNVCFDKVNEETISQYNQHKTWFEAESVYKVDDNAYMRRSLNAKKFSEFDFALPLKYNYKSLVETDLEALYRCYNCAFQESNIRIYHDMTEEERRTDFEYYFQNKNINKEASLVVIKNGEIVGFSLVHSRPREAHLADIGIIQAERGKGLGRRVLNHSLSVASQSYDTITLAVDVENTMAYTLYVDLGFKVQYRIINHVWKHN